MGTVFSDRRLRTDSARVGGKRIWTLWMQGVDSAPPLVRACIDSWRKLNPTWTVVALDESNLADWVQLEDVIDLSRTDLTVQKKSALARLALLRRHGGVWVDATVYCLQPLDAWLPDFHTTGFTVFRNPGPDRLASNWFIAAEPDNELLTAQYEAFVRFFNRRRFSNQDTARGGMLLDLLGRHFNKDVRSTRWWLNPIIQAMIKVYPYFVFHYIFNNLVLTDRRLAAVWNTAPPLDARPPHRLQELAASEDGIEQVFAMLEDPSLVLQKLDWRADLKSPYWSAVMGRLQELMEERGKQVEALSL